jgi:hypothetical protein
MSVINESFVAGGRSGAFGVLNVGSEKCCSGPEKKYHIVQTRISNEKASRGGVQTERESAMFKSTEMAVKIKGIV